MFGTALLGVVLLDVAVVVAPEILNDCTPTVGALTPWLETLVFVVFDRDALLEKPVCDCVAALLGWTGLEVRGFVYDPSARPRIDFALFAASSAVMLKTQACRTVGSK